MSDPVTENDFFFGGGGAGSPAFGGIFGVLLQPLPACLPYITSRGAPACLPLPFPACHPLPLPASLCCIALHSVFKDTKP